MKLPVALCSLLLVGCASYDALTPSASTVTDGLDGTLVVRQPRVAASSSFSEPIHTLGFEWFARDPGLVYLDAGADFGARTGGIIGLSFNADGEVFRADQPNPLTKRDRETHTESSRFSVTFDHFQKIASARIVKMRFDGLGENTMSSFGPGTGPRAYVTAKFAPFLEQVSAARLKR